MRALCVRALLLRSERFEVGNPVIFEALVCDAVEFVLVWMMLLYSSDRR